MQLITLCNEVGKTSSSGVEIFKPTTRPIAVGVRGALIKIDVSRLKEKKAEK